MTDRCPMDNAELTAGMVCPTCGREWQWREFGTERCLVSRRRYVKIVAPLVEGARLDDCIKPAD